MRVLVGWDSRDDLAAKVCRDSMIAKSSVPLEVNFLKDRTLRKMGLYARPYAVDETGQMHDAYDGAPFSTEFSFSRFLVPLICEFKDEWAVFVDADFLWRADIMEMIAQCDPAKAVSCVQHYQQPRQFTKMDGVLQLAYFRKNWSSLMVFNPSRCRTLTKYMVNSESGRFLHGLLWAQDEDIGTIPEEWNWLVGHSPDMEPKAVHYTLGTPDFPGHENDPFADEWRCYASRYAEFGVAHVSGRAA